MTEERPQYYENALSPLAIDAATLASALNEFRGVIRKGAVMMHENSPQPDKWGVGGIFKHFPGKFTLFMIFGAHFQGTISPRPKDDLNVHA